MNQRTPKPWYREPWPWVIIGSLGFVVLVCLAMLVIAIRSDDGLVTDDYYKKGLAINKVLAREQRAEALGLNAELAVLPDGTVRVRLTSREAAFQAPDVVRLRLAHSRFSDQDRVATLARVNGAIGGEVVYSGQLVPPQDGRWTVVLEADEWVLPKAEVQAPVGDVHLGMK